MIVKAIITEIQGIESNLRKALANNAQLKILATDGTINVNSNKENIKASFNSTTFELEAAIASIDKIKEMIESK